MIVKICLICKKEFNVQDYRKSIAKYCSKSCVGTGSKNFTRHSRKREDWLRLCRKCHTEYDDIINKGWITRTEVEIL